MRTTRTLVKLGIALAGAALIAAPPASAGTVVLDLTGLSGSVQGVTVSGVTLTASPPANTVFNDNTVLINDGGSTFTMSVVNGSAVSMLVREYGGCGNPPDVIRLYLAGVEVDSFTVTNMCVEDNSYSVAKPFDQLVYTVNPGDLSGQADLRGISVTTTEPSPVAAPPVIPAWVQAYGRANKEAGCAENWNASWQEWAQPSTGGWVCTRSIPSLGSPTSK